jgi:hypothetical protein
MKYIIQTSNISKQNNSKKKLILFLYSKFIEEIQSGIYKGCCSSSSSSSSLLPLSTMFSESFVQKYERGLNSEIARGTFQRTPLFQLSMEYLQLLHKSNLFHLPCFETLLEILLLNIHPDCERRPTVDEILQMLI